MRTFLPDTIRGRLVATYVLFFLLIALPLSLYVGTQAFRANQEDRREVFAQQSFMIVASLSDSVGRDEPAGTTSLVEQLSAASDLPIAVVDSGGALLYRSTGNPLSAVEINLLLAAVSPESQASSVSIQERDGEIGASGLVASSPSRYALIGPTAMKTGLPFGDIWPQLLVGMLISSAVLALFSWAVAGQIARPLEDLAGQVRGAQPGNLKVTIQPVSPREIMALANAFNQLGSHALGIASSSERQRTLLETIFNSLNEGVVVVNDQEQVILANDPAQRTLDVKVKPGTVMPLVVAVRDHELITHYRATMRSGVPAVGSIQYARHGRLLEATVIPVDDRGASLGIVVVRDVTELRRLESVRKEFVANVSHELRTPLASIRALADTLEGGAIDDRDVAYDFSRRIVDESDRLATLVDELLDLAALESGRMRIATLAVAPGELISKSAERLSGQVEQADLTLTIDVPVGLPDVEADQAKIEQVILNLIHNAIKFTPAGGEISISAREAGENVEFVVSDSGEGIPDEELGRVFERFYKADRARTSQGTGLGLAISKHIVQAHGGEIWAETGIPRGATIRFTLPRATEQPIVALNGDQAHPANHLPAR